MVVLLFFSLAARFFQIGYPPDVVFDEVHWGRYFSSYFTGNYYFDIHPPLGKLIYAGWAYCLGFDPSFVFESGARYPGPWYIGLRALPSLVGAIIPVVIFFLGRGLGMKIASAFIPAWMIALDGALVEVSRFMLLDTFLLFFGFSAILAHQQWLKDGRLWPLVLAGILCAFSFSIKWTGLTFLFLILLRQSFHLIVQKESSRDRASWAGLFVCLLLVPTILYVSQFYLHFSLLTKSGLGDAFMSPAFQSTLSGNAFSLNPQSVSPTFWEKFIEINRVMYSASAGMTAGHPYGSVWYSWPLMLKPIYVWFGGVDKKIYMFGNPLIWWGSLVAALASLQSTLIFRSSRWAPGVGLLLGGWTLNWLPFAEIKRVMFIYHYFPSLIFSMLLVGSLIDSIRRPTLPVLLIALLILCVSLYYSPISFGLAPPWPMLWMPSWT